MNRKSYVLYRMVTLPMTFSDPNCPNHPIFYDLGLPSYFRKAWSLASQIWYAYWYWGVPLLVRAW